MRPSKLHKLLPELSYVLIPRTLFELQVVGYSPRAKTSCMNRLQHPRDPSDIHYVEIKRGLEKFILFLLGWEAETPETKSRGVHEKIVEDVGRLGKTRTSPFQLRRDIHSS